MHFAARTHFEPEHSAYGKALAQAATRGGLIDLTMSNPTRCGFSYPPDLLTSLVNEKALRYHPDPMGLASAREAISQMYRERHAANMSAENVLLTASTSEAYSYLLRLFCEPGDAILVPSPSYPLFDLLAQLHDVDVVTYPLVYHDGWQIDPAGLQAAVTPRTRAIVAIHPNNPTGHYCSAADQQLLLRCAGQHDVPLIVDEVFLDYPLRGEMPASFAALQGASNAAEPVLTFVLGGLSKLLCLPQMKLAWTVVGGPSDVGREALQRLQVIADTFLSVASPPQFALPIWLQHAHGLHQQVLQRVRDNLVWLDQAIAGTVLSRLKVEGGWTVVLRVPANESAVDLAVRLLREGGVAIHPGSFYGFGPRGWLVASLVTPDEVFRAGILALLNAL